jgi:hypothetical protein
VSAKRKVTVFRPRLEKLDLYVTADSDYEATEKALEAAHRRSNSKGWELLDHRAEFYCGDSTYDREPFVMNDDVRPRIFDGEGGSVEL